MRMDLLMPAPPRVSTELADTSNGDADDSSTAGGEYWELPLVVQVAGQDLVMAKKGKELLAGSIVDKQMTTTTYKIFCRNSTLRRRLTANGSRQQQKRGSLQQKHIIFCVISTSVSVYLYIPRRRLGELIILEQLLWVFPYDSHTWVKEHESASGLAAVKLAQQDMNAHQTVPCSQPLWGKSC